MTNKKKILLVEAPAGKELYNGAPMSLLYASAVLVNSIKAGEVQGVEIQDVSVQKPHSRTDLEALLLGQPEIAAISVTTYSVDATHKAVENVREQIPHTVVIVGGPHYDGIVDEWKASPAFKKPFSMRNYFPDYIDIMVTGDGEFALERIAKLVHGKNREDVPRLLSKNRNYLAEGKGNYSVWHRGHLGDIEEIQSRYKTAVGNEKMQFTLNLDELPLPPRELLDEKVEKEFPIFTDWLGRPLRTAQMKTYRGCDFAPTPVNACSFCYVGSKYNRGGIERVVKEIEELGRKGYRALFFDDGVFTSRAPQRKKELEAIVGAVQKAEIYEVGFQTRVDFIDDEVLQILTKNNSINWYCALGVESTEQGILDSVGKKQSKSNAAQAFDLLQRYKLRIGVYLLFGARGDHEGETSETKQSAKESIDFIADYIQKGYSIVSVLPGLDMVLPGTKDATSYRSSKHQEGRPLTYGIMHEGKPWDTFEGGRGFHHVGVSDDLVRFIAEYGYEMIGKAWEADVHSDIYIEDPNLFWRYRYNELRTYDPEIIDFNSAMLAKPSDEVRNAVAMPFCGVDIEAIARHFAAQIAHVADCKKVLFARNTTEALSLVARIADAYRGNVVMSDMEVPSVRRVFEQHMDHGNTNKKDAWSTYGDKQVLEEYEGFPERVLTGVQIREAFLLESKYDLGELVAKVDAQTSAVVISHVDRHTGRIIDIVQATKLVKQKNPQTIVIIDGAQALGKLSVVNFTELESAGIGAYVATPHKNLGAYPLGIAYISKKLQERVKNALRERTPLEQIVMDGMLDRGYGVKPNVSVPLNPKRLVSLVAAIDILRRQGYEKSGDFEAKSQYLEQLKSEFRDRLRAYDSEIITDDGNYSPGILSFRFGGKNQREIVQKLQKGGIFCSYIPQVDAVRVSFETSNSGEDIERYFRIADGIFGYEKPKNIVQLPQKTPWRRAMISLTAAAAIALASFFPSERSSQETTPCASVQKWSDQLKTEGKYPDLAMRMYRSKGDQLIRN